MARSNKFKTSLLNALDAGTPLSEFIKTVSVPEKVVKNMCSRMYNNLTRLGYIENDNSIQSTKDIPEIQEVLNKLKECGIDETKSLELISHVQSNTNPEKINTPALLLAACMLVYDPVRAYSSDLNAKRPGCVVMTPEISFLISKKPDEV